MTGFLSKFSIRQQILIGYVPVFIVLVLLAFNSFNNFQNFNRSFQKLQDITAENLTFLEIERGVVELQRNVLVYSYVGYRGVLKKIEFLQQQLEEKFEFIKPIAEQDEGIRDRFGRLLGHYNDYKEGFKEAIKERTHIENLTQNELASVSEKALSIIESLETRLAEASNYEVAYILNEIENNFFLAVSNAKLFKQFPDAVIIQETRSLVKTIQEDIKKVSLELPDEEILQEVEIFQELVEQYHKAFKDIVRVNRVYINLINVVLAGKAAEIDKLASELDELVKKRSQVVGMQIKDNIHRSQTQFILFSLAAGVIGLVSSLIIATGIANPVRAMASTLSQLALRQKNIEIPGQRRKDEVGQMAKAANEFKTMASELEDQTSELEEFAYRTSHDLRSPLVSSIGLLNLASNALNKGDTDRATKSIKLVESSLKKLETLVKDILELTKTKNVDEDIEVIDFENIIDESIQKLSHMDDFDRIEFTKNLKFIGELKAQKSRMVLIIENLISNAIKYQDIEKKNSFVRIHTEETESHIILSVEDNGLGIPESHQENLFMMFRRFHPKVSFGSGLGLYMMRKSADILNGEMLFEDTGNGSVFKLLISKM